MKLLEVILKGLIKFAPFIATWFAGKSHTEKNQLLKNKKAVNEANKIRHRVRTDRNYLQRVREKFGKLL